MPRRSEFSILWDFDNAAIDRFRSPVWVDVTHPTVSDIGPWYRIRFDDFVDPVDDLHAGIPFGCLTNLFIGRLKPVHPATVDSHGVGSRGTAGRGAPEIS